MKHCFQSILLFLLIFLLHCPAKAQDFDNFSREMIYDTLWSHGNFDFNKPLKDQLLPLDTILIIAIENHPKMKFEEALIERSEYNLKNTKRLWMNNSGCHESCNPWFRLRQKKEVVTGSNDLFADLR